MVTKNKQMTPEILQWVKYDPPEVAIKRLRAFKQILQSGTRLRVGAYIGTPTQEKIAEVSDWLDTEISKRVAQVLVQ